MNDKNLNILVLGSGGREHTLAKVCSRSDCVGKVMVAPGNGGMSDEFEAHDLNIEDNSEIVRLAKEQQVDLVVVGPEVPLCNGAVDALNEAGILAYGPDRAGARLEGSKAYTKDFLNKYGIPTAAYGNFSEIEPALAYLGKLALPVVVKASGLAAGKGVLICQTLEEAEEAVRDMLAGESFGDSGKEVVIEEFLEGEEASLHLICSGESFVAMPMSQDHKKVGEGDTGLNTGGMGAYAPTQLVTPEMLAEYEQSIVRPTLAGLKSEGVDFRGTLYVGLMLTSEGAKVLEFNVRFGDPETQVILPLLADDLVPLLLQSARGRTCPKKSPSRTKAPWWWCSPAPDTRKVIPRVKPSALRRKSLGGRRSFMRVLKKTKRGDRKRRRACAWGSGNGRDSRPGQGKSLCPLRIDRFPLQVLPK